MSATNASDAGISMNEDPVSGAFGLGMDYFELSANERKQVIANATTLEKDEWETLTDRMVQVYDDTLVGIQDLMDAGLTRNVSLATRIDLWQQMSEMTDAEISMDGETTSEEDRVTYNTQGVPIPIVHKDFRIAERTLQTSRRMNNDLRTDEVAMATRSVSHTLEALLFSGWTPTIRDEQGDTFQLYGYTNFPDRNTVSGSGWDDAANIRDDVVAVLDALDEDQRNGPFWGYVAPPQYREYRSAIDPDGDGNMTVRQRIEDEFGAEIDFIKKADYLPEGEAVFVEPVEDVVELAIAEDVQTIEWESGSGMTNHYKVMAAMAPELKSDDNGQAGVAHLTGL